MFNLLRTNKNKLPLWVLFLVLFFTATSYAQSDKLRVGFISPKPQGHAFWGQVIEVMQAVAEDLNIDFVVAYDGSSSSVGTKRKGEQLLKSEPKLDFLLSGYWHAVTKYHIQLARERGIKVFVFNKDLQKDEIEEIGSPRGHFKNWIGHMVPDDFSASKELTRILIEKARTAKSKQDINVYAFMGSGSSTVSLKRNNGLKQQVSDSKDVKLHESSLNMGSLERWNKNWARDQGVKILRENPDIDVIWAGNQSSAWGAVQAVEAFGKSPGKDIFVGGFDWNSESQKALADGRMTASMFGHFIEGAWALILAHDYYYGYDFANDSGIRMETPLSALTTDNYSNYKRMFAPGFWQKIDFRKYSKKYNPDLKKYNFDTSQFLIETGN